MSKTNGSTFENVYNRQILSVVLTFEFAFPKNDKIIPVLLRYYYHCSSLPLETFVLESKNIQNKNNRRDSVL